MENIKFIFDERPFEIRGSEVFRLRYEKLGKIYEELKLTIRHAGKKSGYTLSGAFFTLEEIINLAQKPQHEYTEKITIDSNQ